MEKTQSYSLGSFFRIKCIFIINSQEFVDATVNFEAIPLSCDVTNAAQYFITSISLNLYHQYHHQYQQHNNTPTTTKKTLSTDIKELVMQRHRDLTKSF
jgi:hypothetical protein